ncbi:MULTISPECIES: hypothetical protein [Wolbachia]|nr:MULTISPECIES: hypothetical protein [unclassified Wolbachia]QUI60357.1 hypothetical protein JKF54_05645 [Wolbachia endosymbiont of Spodoptera picta]URG41525.1 hypothetical protein M1L26_000607 [Wolbachia endosymbiont of Ostrinia scapulalis]
MNLFHVTYYPKSDATKPAGIQEFFEHASYAKFFVGKKGWIPVSQALG